MHLENTSPVTCSWARSAGVGAPPNDLTPLALGLDDDDRRPDVLEPEMLATPRLEPPPQPAMSTAAPTSTTRAARARGGPRSRWRALTVSAGRMVNGSFAATFSDYICGRLSFVTAGSGNIVRWANDHPPPAAGPPRET
jgi:hypothetical protein